jgi:RNA polymerase sigma-70 factor, ECF subfamily
MAAPAAWVRVVATRLATSRWRKARNAMTAGLRAHRDERAPDRAGEVLTRTVLVEALQQLSPKQRAAIVLHHLCDLDIASVAEETGCTESAVKSQLFKGRQRLAAHLAEAGYPTLAAFTEENP